MSALTTATNISILANKTTLFCPFCWEWVFYEPLDGSASKLGVIINRNHKLITVEI